MITRGNALDPLPVGVHSVADGSLEMAECVAHNSPNLCVKLTQSAVLQPHFTVLSQLWAGLQDEMVLLNVQEAVALGLQPFLLAQAQLFPPAQLDLLLEGSEVRSDEQRMAESAGEWDAEQGVIRASF